MSGNRPPRSPDNNKRSSKFTSERSSQPDQDPIDRRLKRLREEVLPFYPFLLTVPTDVPFRLGNRFVNNWAVSNEGPFTPEEHQLQYMTFLTHHESDSLLVAVGDWSDETGNVMADPRSRPPSAASTPSNGSIKKKISLNDYKNKRKNGALTSPASQEAAGQSGSALNIPYENQYNPPKTSPASDTHHRIPHRIHSPQLSAQSDSEHVERKRPPDHDHEGLALYEKDAVFHKRRRLSSGPQKVEHPGVNGLPTLLSPTLPPTSRSPRLPRLLSPTLPPDLEKELAKLGNENAALEPHHLAALNGEISKPKAQKTKPSVRGTPHLESTANTVSQSLQSKSSNSLPDKYSLNNIDPSSSYSTSKSDLPSQTRLPQQPGVKYTPKSRLIVKLKYGRPNRKRIEGLLKFSGKRKFAHQESPLRELHDHESISHGTRAEQPRISMSDHSNKSSRVDGKSKHVENSSANPPPRDRSKEPRVSGLEKPRTPIANQTHHEKSRPTSITPAKDLRNISYRSESASNDGKGHFISAARNTPGESSSAAPTKQSPSQSGSSERSGDRRAWKDEYQKYSNLGRELKHAADRHTAKDKVTSGDEKLAAATAIEAILCFMLAFVADDQSKALSRQIGDSSSWLSILAYWRVVKKNSYPYPPLYNLCLILGAVSYDAIHALDLERLAVTPLPGEHTPVPTPASDGHSVASEDNKKSLKDFLELKSRLPDFYKESQRLWYEGARGFSEDILARDFPIIWSKRSRKYSEQGRRRLKPGDYSGEIYLPLGKTNTPVEIIRFSCAILKEWCGKEGIDWSGKLDL